MIGATDMQTTLLHETDLAAYRKNGYVIVEGLLGDDVIARFLSYEAEPKPEGWRSNLRHHVDDEVWGRISREPRVTAIVENLLGAPPRIVQSMYLEKAPAGEVEVGGSGVALHQDLHYLPCDPPKLMACWIALSDTDGENGGLCVVPGSHRTDELYGTHRNENVVDHDSWEFEYTMRDRDGKVWKEKMYSFQIEGIDEKDVVRLTVPKGAGVFFDGRTVHGSFGNRSKTRYRRAFATHYVPDGTWLFRTDVQETVPAV